MFYVLLERNKIGIEWNYVNYVHIQGGPKKVSHYHLSSLNRIKTDIKATFFTNFDYKMSKRM